MSNYSFNMKNGTERVCGYAHRLSRLPLRQIIPPGDVLTLEEMDQSPISTNERQTQRNKLFLIMLDVGLDIHKGEFSAYCMRRNEFSVDREVYCGRVEW